MLIAGYRKHCAALHWDGDENETSVSIAGSFDDSGCGLGRATASPPILKVTCTKREWEKRRSMRSGWRKRGRCSTRSFREVVCKGAREDLDSLDMSNWIKVKKLELFLLADQLCPECEHPMGQ